MTDATEMREDVAALVRAVDEMLSADIAYAGSRALGAASVKAGGRVLMARAELRSARAVFTDARIAGMATSSAPVVEACDMCSGLNVKAGASVRWNEERKAWWLLDGGDVGHTCGECRATMRRIADNSGGCHG